MSEINELPRPRAVETASRSMEMARIWIVDNTQHVVLSPNLWDKPGTWGIMLVDLANHVANAYAEKGYGREQVLSDIWLASQAERLHPTAEVERE